MALSERPSLAPPGTVFTPPAPSSTVPQGSVVVLAAGRGTRMRSALPKVVHRACGRTLLGWVLEGARSLNPERVVLVLGSDAEAVQAALEADGELRHFSGALGQGTGPTLEVVIQEPQLGTGHALQIAAPALTGTSGAVTVLYGDMPLLRPESLQALVAGRPAGGASMSVARVADPSGYGRVLRSESGAVQAVVEHRDASPDQLAIDEINVGLYSLPAELVDDHLARLSSDNAPGELYLTDLVGTLVADGVALEAVELEDLGEAQGVNTLAQLSSARAELQERLLLQHMAAGVRIEDPATTYIDHDVEIGADTVVLPCTVLRAGVRIGTGCEVGPFTHLRTGSVLEDGAAVGNFTELKQARLGKGTKAKHLSYLGNVEVGADANIGAGTIVANYDGKHKHATTIADRAFIGSGSILIAPCAVGEGALVGAGAVVKRNSKVPAGEAWVGVPARALVRRADADSDAS